ncbi:MAG: LON peptidase substrate-binding domain-containing protein, partial [Acidobacteriota bacterium]
MSRLLPLFPLQLVAFPGSAIPLHIFEERYKEMVGEAEAAGTEFGIVLTRDGGIVNAGCTVIVESVLERYPDGRFDVLTRGRRRFSLVSINEEKEYLRGEVEFFGDEDWTSVTPELRDRALQAFRTIRQALQGAGDEVPQAEPDPEHPMLSFQLAQVVDDLDFQNVILRSRSETERLQHLIDVAGPYLARREYKTK